MPDRPEFYPFVLEDPKFAEPVLRPHPDVSVAVAEGEEASFFPFPGSDETSFEKLPPLVRWTGVHDEGYLVVAWADASEDGAPSSGWIPRSEFRFRDTLRPVLEPALSLRLMAYSGIPWEPRENPNRQERERLAAYPNVSFNGCHVRLSFLFAALLAKFPSDVADIYARGQAVQAIEQEVKHGSAVSFLPNRDDGTSDIPVHELNILDHLTKGGFAGRDSLRRRQFAQAYPFFALFPMRYQELDNLIVEGRSPAKWLEHKCGATPRITRFLGTYPFNSHSKIWKGYLVWCSGADTLFPSLSEAILRHFCESGRAAKVTGSVLRSVMRKIASISSHAGNAANRSSFEPIETDSPFPAKDPASVFLLRRLAAGLTMKNGRLLPDDAFNSLHHYEDMVRSFVVEVAAPLTHDHRMAIEDLTEQDRFSLGVERMVHTMFLSLPLRHLLRLSVRHLETLRPNLPGSNKGIARNQTWGEPMNFLSPDGATLHVLRTYSELYEEGQAMAHCVASYLSSCQSGHSCIVSVRDQNDVRLSTLEIQLRANGFLIPAQHLGYKNSSPDAAAVRATDWLMDGLADQTLSLGTNAPTVSVRRGVTWLRGLGENWNEVAPTSARWERWACLWGSGATSPRDMLGFLRSDPVLLECHAEALEECEAGQREVEARALAQGIPLPGRRQIDSRSTA